MKRLIYIFITAFLCIIPFKIEANAETPGSAICVYDSPKNYANKFSITCRGVNNCQIDTNLELTIASNAASITIGNTCPSNIYITIINNTMITSINKTSGSSLSLNKNKSTENNTSSGENNPSSNTEYEKDKRYIAAKAKADKYCAPANTSSGYVDNVLCTEAKQEMGRIKESYLNSTTPPSSNSETYETDNRYIEAKKDADKYCDETNFAYQDDEKCKEAKKKMDEIKAQYAQSPSQGGNFDAGDFCSGPVQGVFTTIGWVFFIIKILVPILLIIFGSIDVGKAVVASKDDEIKKSIKTLALRAIAGAIIFFVPTILNIGVKLIDNSEVYSGTFWDCTKCMLDPINNVCSGLRSEE